MQTRLASVIRKYRLKADTQAQGDLGTRGSLLCSRLQTHAHGSSPSWGAGRGRLAASAESTDSPIRKTLGLGPVLCYSNKTHG